jgi:predicted nucleic acid-binding protein
MEEEEEMTHRAILARMEQAPLEALAAEQAALWLRQTPGGSEALFRDALIAATAAERGEPIYTRNVRDFKRFYANVQSY